jgi:FAD-linked oxidoreductase
MSVSRRHLLIGAGAGVAALGGGVSYLALNAGDPAEAVLPPTADGKQRWRNWSGLQHCDATAIAVPKDESELADVLTKSGGPIRPVGAGHSFTPLVPTEGTVLSLDRMHGLVSHDATAMTATVRAGTRLFALGEALEDVGQAMEALPDINKQSLAGAMATATHGTGRAFSSLASFAAGLTLMTPDGKTQDCSAEKNAELFEAARVSLGALGVITSVTLKNRGPLRVKRRTWFAPFAEILESCKALAGKHRHFEFYAIPFTGMAYCIAHDETDEPETPRGANAENDGVDDLMLLRDYTSWAPWLRRGLARQLISGTPTEEVIGTAWRLLSTERPARFNEMEYHVPQEAVVDALREVVEEVERHSEVYFPLEVRFIAPETAWLSPFHGRASCSIATHMGATQDFKPVFDAVEPILRKHGGRPHWGKLHTLGASDFAALYPRWKEFLDVRAACDPNGRMLNAHLRAVFGVA